ncbi:hypothetical protein EVAR_82390_1 [Eumeta japonica]|uniref:Uncharacterized protein n=1 Tax=Eumeta variegata TaxID=151549 RepID=A0A4C1U9Y8_EUMVA|nr:hypothetical protein EVAR_82390_1 [Eumeta japonica]
MVLELAMKIEMEGRGDMIRISSAAQGLYWIWKASAGGRGTGGASGGVWLPARATFSRPAALDTQHSDNVDLSRNRAPPTSRLG